MTALLDGRGRPVRLGRELGRGGEGAVFALDGEDGVAAKLYHGPVEARQAGKIGAMVHGGDERLRRLAAWPLDSLHDARSGRVTGFLMPRVAAHRPIHLLYGPKSRLTTFPAAGWPFLIQAASNLARAFAVLHRYGHVIGDVNHGNVLVSEWSTVTLIDCDSFQVAAGGERYLCEVGVATHQPPELQGRSFRGLVRTPDHDNFGLAVLIFQLLFMARHPFSGRYLGGGEMPLERAIAQGRFAYGARAAARQMQRPPASLALDAVGPPLAALFERAFAPAGGRAGGRPDGAAWSRALDDLAGQLTGCGRNAAHEYLAGLPACPWCRVEAEAGAALFNAVARTARQPAGFDLAAVWARIAAVPGPGPTPALPDPSALRVRPDAGARRQGYVRRGRLGLGMGIVLAGVMLALLLASGLLLLGIVGIAGGLGYAVATIGAGRPRAAAARELAAARRRWRAVEARWREEASERRFASEREALSRWRVEYGELPERRRRLLAELRTDPRRSQAHRFLLGHRLDAAAIGGLGEGRRAVLQSYGIETAADLSEAAIRAVPGFGPGLTGALLSWRREVERRFTFDPGRGLDGRDAAAAERTIDDRRHELERLLSSGAAALSARSGQIAASRTAIGAEARRAARALAQAEASYRAL